MPKWAKKEQEIHDAEIPDPLEDCTVCTRNWIWGHSRIDDSGRSITSSSEVTSVVEKAKTLTTKEKTGEFKSRRERDQLNVAVENEEHRDCTRAISSIASWKEGFTDESHLYKKCKTQEIAHNAEETFAQQLFNFMRKNLQYVVQIPSPEINLDLGVTVQQPFPLSSVGSAPNKDKNKYHVDDIKNPTPCTLIYVKCRTSWTIEVVEATVMPSRIHHGWPVPTECAVVEVTTIREGHELRTLTTLMKMRGLKNWLMLKELSFSGPAKILLSKPIRRRLFHHGAQRLGALLLQTCRSLLKSLIH
jgi:hypothetical protein